MQYDKLQDYISPALDNAARAAENVQQAIVEMQDKEVADAAAEVAQKQADIINNFDEFSLQDPQGEMVNRSMKEWDKFMADMPVAARRRFDRNNPKAREIFKLKTEEAATKRARQYTTAKKKADVDRTSQDIIAGAVGPDGKVNPAKVKERLQYEYDNAGKTMTPDDLVEYQKLLGSTTQQGAIMDAISRGQLAEAKALNEDREFTANLSPEQIAKNRQSIQRLMNGGSGDGDGSGSGSGNTKGGSLYNTMVLGTGDAAGSALRAMEVYNAIASGLSMEDVLKKTALRDDNGELLVDENGNFYPIMSPDDVIFGGKTLREVYDNMYPEERQKLMKKAKEAAMVENTPAMVFARAEVGHLNELITESQDSSLTADARQAATEKADIQVFKMLNNGSADILQLGADDGFKATFLKALDAALARNDQENQTMTSVSNIYGIGRVDVGSHIYDDTDVLNVMSLPQTPANETQAMFEDFKWTGKMSKADLVIPQKVDSSIANLKIVDYVQGNSGSAFFRRLEKNGQVPMGLQQQWNEELKDIHNGITPMCLTNDVTFQEYADCLYKKGWRVPYSQTAEFDQEKRNTTNMAASGRILARTGDKSKEADYNEGTYAWALDVVDGLIMNEIFKNDVYKQEAGLQTVTVQQLNASARDYRQELRDKGLFDKYIDTSHFADNGFDSFNPNRLKECAADIKQSALYDFVNDRIYRLGGKLDTPQAEKIAEFMRGAIKGKDIKMKADVNLNAGSKTANPGLRGAGKVAQYKMTSITKSILKANEEE
jgi:hypothetical protein